MKLIPNTSSIIHLINYAFQYVIDTSLKYNIDESHALKHSMEVFRFAKQIYDAELPANPFLLGQKEVVYMAAIGHDMCDKKYVDEKEAILRYQDHLSRHMSDHELQKMGEIIGTMSYSKVKKNGFPTNLGDHQLAYHIVREADLLAAYDIDRSIIYNMYTHKTAYTDSLPYVFKLFDERVFRMIEDELFTTCFSKQLAVDLHLRAKEHVDGLKHF